MLWLKVGWSVIFGKKRSVLKDSQYAFSDGRPQIRFLGLEHLPAEEPCLVVCNHNTLSGFTVIWLALGISAAFEGRRANNAEEDVHWVMTAAWTYPDEPLKARLMTPITRWVFARLARAYGFINMPPMPPAPHEVQARAASVLKTIRLARQGRDQGVLIGLAPEGQDNNPRLGEPPEGVGEFIAHLVNAGLAVLPVGVYEDRDTLVVSFGEVFVPEIPLDRSERDKVVASEVMSAIKEQLPEQR